MSETVHHNTVPEVVQQSVSTMLESAEPLTLTSKEELKFYPQENWGLDYYFRVFNKMYICDVLCMPEYPLFPGSFCYKNHPIYKVEVIGVVVKVIERSKCFIYAVDDGTGVISCCCWKNEQSQNDGISLEDSLPEKLRQKLEALYQSKQVQSNGYSLGDLLHVRGKIKVYMGQKEIVAVFHNRIDNPMVEVSRMAELPKLYKQNYDKPFKLPHKVAQELDMIKQEEATGVKCQKRIVKELKEMFLHYFHEVPVTELSAHELMQLSSVQQSLQKFIVTVLIKKEVMKKSAK